MPRPEPIGKVPEDAPAKPVYPAANNKPVPPSAGFAPIPVQQNVSRQNSPVQDMPHRNPPQNSIPQPYPQPSREPGPPRQKQSRALLIAVIILICILLVGVVLVLILMLSGRSDGNNASESTSVSETVQRSSDYISLYSDPSSTSGDAGLNDNGMSYPSEESSRTVDGGDTDIPEFSDDSGVSDVPAVSEIPDTSSYVSGESMKIPQGTYRFLQELAYYSDPAPEKYFISDIDGDERFELIVLTGRADYSFYRYNDGTGSFELAFKENASSGAFLPEEPGFCNGRFCMRYYVRGEDPETHHMGTAPLYYYLSGDIFVEGSAPSNDDDFNMITMRSIDVDWTEDVVIPDAEVRPLTTDYLERLMDAYGITDRESKINFLDDRLTEILALHGFIFARYEDVDDNGPVPDGAVLNPSYVKYSKIGWYTNTYYKDYAPEINNEKDHQPGTYNKKHYYNGTTEYTNVSPSSVVDNYNVILYLKKSL